MNNYQPSGIIPGGCALLTFLLVIVAAIGIRIYDAASNYMNTPSNTNSNTAQATPTRYPANTMSSPTATPADTAAINTAPVNVSPTVDAEKEKQKGANLKSQLDVFLQDTAKDMGSENGSKWNATKDKSFYADIDNDGLEDAVFRFTASEKDSDNIWEGFVVFRNSPEKYVYVDKYYFGALDQIDILSFEVQKGGIKLKMKEYEESTMGEDEDSVKFKMVNKNFVIRDNRLQQK